MGGGAFPNMPYPIGGGGGGAQPMGGMGATQTPSVSLRRGHLCFFFARASC